MKILYINIVCLLLLNCSHLSVYKITTYGNKSNKMNLNLEMDKAWYSSYILLDTNKKVYLLKIKDILNCYIYNLLSENQYKIPNDNKEIIEIFISSNNFLISLLKGKSSWKILNLEKKSIIREINRKSFIAGVSKNLKYFLLGQDLFKTPSLWDVNSGKELYQFENITGQNLSFSLDDNKFVTGDKGSIFIYNIKTGKKIFKLNQFGELLSTSFSPDSRYLATGSGKYDGDPYGCTRLLPIYDYKVRLWKLETGDVVKTFEGHKGAINKVKYSPNGMLIASASSDKTAKIWNVKTGTLQHSLNEHYDYVYNLEFSPDGNLLFTYCMDKITRVWDVKTGKKLCSIVVYGEKGLVIITPDGRYDGDEEGIKNLYWQSSDNIRININEYKKDLLTKGLLKSILGIK